LETFFTITNAPKLGYLGIRDHFNPWEQFTELHPEMNHKFKSSS
jgi:hypothetical protein